MAVWSNRSKGPDRRRNNFGMAAAMSPDADIASAALARVAPTFTA